MMEKKNNPTVVGQHGVSQPKIAGNVIQYKIITLHDTWYFWRVYLLFD